MDILLAVVVFAVQVVLTYVGVHLTIKQGRKGAAALIFSVGVGGMVLTGVAAKRNTDAQAELAGDIKGLRVDVKGLGADNVSLRQALDERDRLLSAVSKRQLEVAEKELLLKYELAPIVTYDRERKRLLIQNNGRANFLFWGSRLGRTGQRSIESEPRTISPGSHYYLLADTLEDQVRDQVKKVGPEGDIRGPFEVYMEDGLGRKHTVRYHIWGLMEPSGQVAIHTQFIKIDRTDWSKAQP